jgi:hypothetical protein
VAVAAPPSSLATLPATGPAQALLLPAAAGQQQTTAATACRPPPSLHWQRRWRLPGSGRKRLWVRLCESLGLVAAGQCVVPGCLRMARQLHALPAVQAVQPLLQLSGLPAAPGQDGIPRWVCAPGIPRGPLLPGWPQHQSQPGSSWLERPLQTHTNNNTHAANITGHTNRHGSGAALGVVQAGMAKQKQGRSRHRKNSSAARGRPTCRVDGAG